MPADLIQPFSELLKKTAGSAGWVIFPINLQKIADVLRNLRGA
jgi:hypothetical protein